MKYTISETEAAVTLQPASAAVASVVWLHGLGADGSDFVPIIPELHLPEQLAVRFIFPHAAVRPVTINNGHRMRAWYDIMGFAPGNKEDEEGIRDSGRIVAGYVDREREAGIASAHIVIAGFSQGGAIALHAGLRYGTQLGGILALSTYLPLKGKLAGETTAVNANIPILMCHGTQDPVVPLDRGVKSRDVLTAAGYAVDFREYPMQHEVSMPEIQYIAGWLAARCEP
ncbi:MAG: carboxylesterase [Steroidobacteraceae bacterium]